MITSFFSKIYNFFKALNFFWKNKISRIVRFYFNFLILLSSIFIFKIFVCSYLQKNGWFYQVYNLYVYYIFAFFYMYLYVLLKFCGKKNNYFLNIFKKSNIYLYFFNLLNNFYFTLSKCFYSWKKFVNKFFKINTINNIFFKK